MSAKEQSTITVFPSRRKLASWTDAFYDYTDNKGSPGLFRRWAGIFAIAAALERKVWIRTAKGILYPNLYVIKVGPPGAGKTLATAVAHDIVSELDDHFIAPTSVTKASLIDALAEAERRIVRPQDVPPVVQFNSLTVMSDELGVLIPAYENDFMNVLTNIYDCRVYSETRRTAKINIKMDNPQINMIAATTPSYLNNLLPEGAWDQGFLSRTMLIYSGAEPLGDLWEIPANDKLLHKNLVEDLKTIGNLYGPMKFNPDAAEAISVWAKTGGEPVPDHPKLTHYNTRRLAHLLKLCMIASVSQSDNMVVTLEHYVEALDWLVEAERSMEDIFKSMKTGGDQRIMEEAYHFTYQIWMREGKKPVLEHRVAHFVAERAPSHSVARILEVMERARILEKQFTNGGMGYVPKARQP